MKPALIFVHGWSGSVQVWHGQLKYFSGKWPVQGINLPGHGGAPDAPADAWAARLREAFPDRSCILVGWSLGGMLSLQLAHACADRLAGLVLVSSTPCFRTKAGWIHGCPDRRFSEFKQALEKDSAKLLGQFFTLMLYGEALSASRRDAIAKAAIDRKRPPSTQALRTGLQFLEHLDLRPLLADIRVPALVIHGEYDAVVPAAAGRYLAKHLPDASLHVMRCGHAPHLTQTDEFNHMLEAWCRTNISIRNT